MAVSRPDLQSDPFQEMRTNDHVAVFIIQIIDVLDLSEFIRAYQGRGKDAYHPRVMLGLLLMGYLCGERSCRKIEDLTYQHRAYKLVAGNCHPNHDTLARFRKRFLSQYQQVSQQVLCIAFDWGILTANIVASFDGSKVHANASRSKALSWQYANRLEAQLLEEVSRLRSLAAQCANNPQERPQGMDISYEVALRENKLKTYAWAKDQILQRAQERYQIELIDYESKLAVRESKKAAGIKVGGPIPKPPQPDPSATDQVNLTDPDSRIMHIKGKGYEQCYNVQALVDTSTMLVIVGLSTQASNDVGQIKVLLPKIATFSEQITPVKTLIADAGYCSQANIIACAQAGIEPVFAVARESHHPDWAERFAPDPPPPQGKVHPVAQMTHFIKTQAGKALYALRKQTVEPVFGAIKEQMRWRQMSLRGLCNVQGEWDLVALAWNIKRLFQIKTGLNA